MHQKKLVNSWHRYKNISPTTPYQGFVLLSVLVFLQIFACISCFCLSQTSQSLKINQHKQMADKNYISTMHILKHIESQVSCVSCFISVIGNYDLRHKPLSWWKENACGGQFADVQFYYVVEMLEQNECTIIDNKHDLKNYPIHDHSNDKKSNNQEFIAEYYRITLFVLPFNLKSAKRLMQSIYTMPSQYISTCPSNEKHTVTFGRQTLRELVA